MKTDLFQSCGHCWVFQICWHIECSTFTASFFRILNSSVGIPSPPLALFVVMLPKALLTSHSKMQTQKWLVNISVSFLLFFYYFYVCIFMCLYKVCNDDNIYQLIYLSLFVYMIHLIYTHSFVSYSFSELIIKYFRIYVLKLFYLWLEPTLVLKVKSNFHHSQLSR